MTDMLTMDILKELAGTRGNPCISIYMPTFRAGRRTEQGPIRLKNLLKQAEIRLGEGGHRAPEIRALLEPAEALLTDNHFWQHQSDGLAIFLSADGLIRYRLPVHFDELAVTAGRFHILPLFQVLADDGQFFILAISQNTVRLLQCTRYSHEAMNLEGLSGVLEQSPPHGDSQKTLQSHTGSRTPGAGGKPSAIFHGHGVGAEDAKANILKLFHRIDKGLQEHLREAKAPLILAGVDYLLPIYREANTYLHLSQEGIEGNPEVWSDEELHAQAWKIVHPVFAKAGEQAVTQFQKLSNTRNERASHRLEEIIAAAHGGRVETLLVAGGVQQWGAFDPRANRVQISEKAGPGSEELLDLAAVQTFLNGGTVYAMDRVNMPDQSTIAAIFRY